MSTLTEPAADRTSAPPTMRRRWAVRLGRGTLAVVAVVAVLAVVGATVQAIAERRDAAAHPAPGEMIVLSSGRQLHLQVSGEEHDGPTVVLEGGAGASSAAWAWIQPAIAEHATVVSYDRAGLGWSDAGSRGPEAENVIADLREALAARGLPGPYVLVGHSLGGHHVRAFTAEHPDEVVGMVLVDPSHERAAEVLGMTSDQMWPMFTALRTATRLGLMRVYNPFVGDIELLPEPARDQALTHLASTRYARAFSDEMASVDSIGSTLPTGKGALGDLPLRVLIARGGATTADQQRQVDAMSELRRDMQSMSTEGATATLDEASHVSIVTDERHASVVSDTVVDLLEALR